MAKFKVAVTDQVFPSVDVERSLLAKIDAELTVLSGTIDEVLPHARGADALLNTYLPFDRDAIAQLDQCRIIARYGIGIDNIDLAAARDANIVVTNVPDYCVEEVATHALALILSLVRRVHEGDALARKGQWGLDGLRPIARMSELTVGLVGYGRIARQLGDVLSALGSSLLVFDPYLTPDAVGNARLVGLDELLQAADIVSLHAPLTDDTRGIIGARELGLMPQHAILVNTSRGPLVALKDLADALQAGEIRAAALDVFEQEPPNVEQLRDIPNLLMTPHMAYYSESAIQESQQKAATQIIKVLTGEEPDYQVNRA